MGDSLCANCSILINLYCKLQGFFVLRVSCSRHLTQSEVSQHQPEPEWLPGYTGWTFLLCHCQLCCETASLFLLLCHISLKTLDRAKLGGESCTILLARWNEIAWPGVLHQSRGRFPAGDSCFPQSPVTPSNCVCVWCVQGQLLQGNLSSAHRIPCLTLSTESFPRCLHLKQEVAVVCCNMRKAGLPCTTLTPNARWVPHCWTFFHIHTEAAASVPGITRNLGLAALAQVQSCFSLTSPSIVVAFTVSAAEGLSGWQKAKKWQPHLEDPSHGPKPKHYLCGEDGSCVITRVGISNECWGCVCTGADSS